MIVPGGGLSEDGSRWIASRPRFLVHLGKFAAVIWVPNPFAASLSASTALAS
jgi:hypothetical protein